MQIYNTRCQTAYLWLGGFNPWVVGTILTPSAPTVHGLILKYDQRQKSYLMHKHTVHDSLADAICIHNNTYMTSVINGGETEGFQSRINLANSPSSHNSNRDNASWCIEMDRVMVSHNYNHKHTNCSIILLFSGHDAFSSVHMRLDIFFFCSPCWWYLTSS